MTLPALFFIFLALFTVIMIVQLRHAKADAMLQKWADAHQYQILNKQLKLFRRGPFFWTTSKNQVIYRVALQDTQGNVREAWARCGGFWMGLLSDKVDVRWDGPAPQPVEIRYIDSEPRRELVGARPSRKPQPQKADARRYWWDA
jgi:hypothetical protein